MNEISTRSLTVAYSMALAIVAALSFFSHITINNILHEQEGSAAIINISGRQRMLSQRIASFAAQHALGDPEAKDELIATADRFERYHRALAHGDATLKIPAPTSPALASIYASNGGGLDDAVKAFAARARVIANLAPGTEALRAELTPLLADARMPLLDALDEVVTFQQRASETHLARLETLQGGSLIVVLLTLIAEAMGIFRPMVAKIQRYTSELLRIANRDPLTGALNRKGFADHAAKELSRANRYRRPTSFLMLDADHFKLINDRHGHAGGDAALGAIANALGECLRPADILGRLGGEEFGILLPETGLQGAIAAAERIRKRVETLQVTTKAGTFHCTISIGATDVDPGAIDLKSAMDRADAALYRAKEEGRNRVSASPAPSLENVVPDAPAMAEAG
jgi:diguanylate cyclase (GGDEF)-like protein